MISVTCVRWNDNCPVAITSHYFTVTPISKTERWFKNEHRRAAEQPHVVKMYNPGMGGWTCATVCCHDTDRGCHHECGGIGPKQQLESFCFGGFSLLQLRQSHEGYSYLILKRNRKAFGKSRSKAPFGWPYSATKHNKIRRRETYTEICLTRCVFCQKNTRP